MNLTADQNAILDYLKTSPDDLFPAPKIARHAAGKDRYFEDPRWANHGLASLLDLGLVEMGDCGRYRIKTIPAQKCQNRQAFVAPHLQEILKQKGYCTNCLYRDCPASQTTAG